MNLGILSLEFDQSTDHEFVLEIKSPYIKKMRIIGFGEELLVGCVKFYVNTPEIYFIDLIDFHLRILNDPTSILPQLFGCLRSLKLLVQVEIEPKMMSLFRLLSVPLSKNTM